MWIKEMVTCGNDQLFKNLKLLINNINLVHPSCI
jgi:hypothetical protein